jgi:hypothetical protein
LIGRRRTRQKKKKRNPQSPAQRQGRVSSSVARPNPRFWGDRATLRAVNDSEQGRCGGRHMSRPLIYHIAGRRPFSVSCNRATARTWLLTGRRANSHTQDRTDFTSRRRTLAEHRACRRVPDPLRSRSVSVLRCPAASQACPLQSSAQAHLQGSSILLVRGRRRGTAVLVLVGRGLQETALAVCCGCWVGGEQLGAQHCQADTHVLTYILRSLHDNGLNIELLLV